MCVWVTSREKHLPEELLMSMKQTEYIEMKHSPNKTSVWKVISFY